ncbi:YfeC-like transcriptional regulator [Shigella flexneri]
MTPEELALLTGYSRQTINNGYAKRVGYMGTKARRLGGKARLVHVNEKCATYSQRTRQQSRRKCQG